MMNGRITLIAAVAMASTLSASTQAQDAPKSPATKHTWALTPDNRLMPIAPSATPTQAQRPASLDELNAIDAILTQGRYGQAFDRLQTWFKRYPDSGVRDRALLMSADALIGLDERIKAFYYCDELMDRHPESAFYAAALQKQYDIADAYLNGARDTWLGMHLLDRDDEALEMLFRIQTRSPGSPVSENAMLRSADFYWAHGDWDFAADAYAAYARTYPRSPRAEQARLREAYANLAQVRGPVYDPTPIINARATLTELSASNPDLAKKENLAEKIQLADRFLARKIFLGAEFYKRTGKKDAAVSLYKRLINLYPNLPEADEARAAVTRLGGTL
ncbi:MAG: outer membrane protein assembly factor BamD [Tepidisphaeraceae bacterium]